MIKEADILKLRLRAASKFIHKRISITEAKGATVSLNSEEVFKLLEILNPTKPFTYTEPSEG